MFGGLGDMLKQAQKMQKGAAELKEQLETKRIEGVAGGGLITVTVSGVCEVLSVSIDERLYASENDKAMFESLIQEATNDALGKAKELIKQEVGKLTGGLPIPGLS